MGRNDDDRKDDDRDEDGRKDDGRSDGRNDDDRHLPERADDAGHGDSGPAGDLATAGYLWQGEGRYDQAVKLTVTEAGGQARVSIDGGSARPIVGGDTIRVGFDTAQGEPAQEDMLLLATPGTGWILVPEADSRFSPGAQLTAFRGWQPDAEDEDDAGDDGGNDAGDDGRDGPDRVICFTPSSMIHTPDGRRPAGQLRAGDRVLTADNGVQTIRWVGRSRIAPLQRMRRDLHPVRLRAGALGPGLPDRDLWVSPQHRFCLAGPQLELSFGLPEALVPALALVDAGAALRPAGAAPVTYVHLLLDRHEIIFANGLACESLYPGPQALRALHAAARRDLQALFPALADDPASYGATARHCLRRREAAALGTMVAMPLGDRLQGLRTIPPSAKVPAQDRRPRGPTPETWLGAEKAFPDPAGPPDQRVAGG